MPVAPAYAATNEIVVENAKTGNPASEWDISGAGDPSIQGFATKLSVDQGETVDFKIDLEADPGAAGPVSYTIDIYRLGYYGGDGARRQGDVDPATINPENQPACEHDEANGDLLDCGNWNVSASWQVPATAVSGIYLARLARTDDTSKASHIVFVVRDDDGGSDLLFQTSDTTWQAYNPYGGYNAYNTAALGTAQKLSYNRPFTTRGGELENWLFNAEYPMLRWLERNGYDVSYTTHIDTGTRPDELLEHKAFLSVGHDEYWSADQRASVENARDQGVNLAFFSGNEVYWKVRWEDSAIDAEANDQRIMVVYKEGNMAPLREEHRECYDNFDCDPTTTWTGLWRESTDGNASIIGSPENSVSGQISWRLADAPITVPSDYASLRFWRNTEVADLTGTGTVTLEDHTLGYEFDPQYEQFAAWYPAGRVLMSATDVVTFAGNDRHHLSLYRAPGGALVFGAGTVQWMWGLDTGHDRDQSHEDRNMQQASVNLLADMGAQPETLQDGLVGATATTDITPPTVAVTSPADGATVPGGQVTVTGTASDVDGAVGVVEVSTDGGTSWHAARGRETWSYTYVATAGSNTVRVRAADDSANLGEVVSVSFVAETRTCTADAPCSIFGASIEAVEDPDTASVELGVKFGSSTAGFITGVRFYKTAGNTGTHTGTLWSDDGDNLATVVFSGESDSGWQEATFGAPVAIEADTTYIASYHAPDGGYAQGTPFVGAGVDNPPLHALAGGEDGPNGVYALSSKPTFPTDSAGSSNYLVDVLFAAEVGPDVTPPVVVSTIPSANAVAVSVTTRPSATFSEPMDAASINSTSVVLRDSQGVEVPATVAYGAATRTVTIEPAAALKHSELYEVTIVGGTGGVRDVALNTLAEDRTWTFTTAVAPTPRPDPNTGPGGPVLAITGSGTFGTYLPEILRAEGFNLFATGTTASLTPAGLEPYTTVVLGESVLDADQVTALTAWVTNGGNLIAMRPDAQLADLLGLTPESGTLAEGYVKVNGTTAPGAGIVTETMQFHGTADHYSAKDGTQVVARLYTDASTSTAHPAVTVRNVGAAGGSAAAFTYDLARSVVLTRQGNPAWVNQNRDGRSGPNRPGDLFYGDWEDDPQPDFVDLSKVDIPQADEQQRLLANIITTTSADALPLPRFWYLPRGEKAAIVMTGDNHDGGSVSGRFAQEIAKSPASCSVLDWECIRSTSYLYPSNTRLSATQAQGFQDQGFEIALHPYTGCVSPTAEDFADQLSTQLGALGTRFPSLTPSATSRNHCIAWSDYTTVPEELDKVGIHLDTNYYYWPGSWVDDRPGLFTGSGFPQRFARTDGTLVDVYQATTQLTDESGQSYPSTAIALMDAALNKGYYGTFVANIHSDGESEALNEAIIDAAKARSVPVISAKQLLTWTDGRNSSTFANLNLAGGALTFDISAAAGSNGLEAMLPVDAGNIELQSVSVGGVPVATTPRTVHGVDYLAFPAAAGSYTATYGADTTAPVITDVTASANADGTVGISWTTDEPATSRVDYGTATDQLVSSEENATLTTAHHLTIPGVSRTVYYRVTSADGGGYARVSPELAEPAAEFRLPTPVVTDDTMAHFTAGSTDSTSVSDAAGGEVILTATVGAEFDGTALPTGWSTTQWTSGSGGSIVSGGQVTVDGSLLVTDASFTPARSLEFVATFGGSTFEHAGLGVDVSTVPRWAMFSTHGDGAAVYARTSNAGVTSDVRIGSQFVGSPHRYRIDWLADSVVFSIDGTAVHTEPVAITGEMRPLVSDYAAGGAALAVDWMRLTPYATRGSFVSRVHDAGGRADWETFSWTGEEPSGTRLDLSVRTGNTATPDATWTVFAPINSGGDVTTRSRYLQYQATAFSAVAATPVLASVSVGYELLSDQAAPTVLSHTPEDSAMDVALTTAPTITFNEAVDPATITATSVRLRAVGAISDVAATLALDGTGSVLTLTPAAPLAPYTVYTATVTTDVTDMVGNSLADGSSWHFTTTYPICAAGEFRGEYYTGMDLAGTPLLVRCETEINNTWGDGGPGGPVPADNFSVRWTGNIDFSADQWAFTTVSDDGIRLSIDSTLLIDNWTDHDVTTNTATATLVGGTHTLTLEYYEKADTATAQLSWTPITLALPPTQVVGTSGPILGSVNLSWTAPANDGGSPVTGYEIQKSSAIEAPVWTAATVVGSSTSTTVSGLTRNASYIFRVRAVNSLASSAWSAPSAAVRASTVPGAPTGVVGSNATSWSVDLSWTPPVDNGGLVIDKYVVYASIDGGTTWTLFGYEQPATTWTWTGLTPDTTYRFKAHAHNSAGWSVASAASAEVTTLAQSMPSAPRSVAGVAGNNKVALTWQVPSSTGGSPITSYGVDYSSDSGATWSTALAPSAAMTATSYTVNGLTNGQAYRFRVVAVNAIGSGPWSATSATYTPHSTVPGAPTGVVGSNATSWSVDLSWTPPVDNGGLVIDKYVVYASIDGGTTWTLFGYEQPATTWTWTGLTPDTTYRFKAHAHNSAGWSVASAASAEVTTLAQSMPSAPRSVAGVAGNNKVALTWQVPSSTGGSPITSYGVDYSSDSGATWSTALAPSAAMTATSYTVNGLTNGQAYRFRVVAVNAIGSGPWSATSATYTPHSTVPGAPTGVVGSNATSWSVDLSWTPPVDNGGLVIDKYVVYASIDGGTTWTLFGYEQPATTWTWTGLTPDTTYRFKAHAHNSAGWSVASAASAEVTTLAQSMPSAPRSVAGVAGNNKVALTWQVPSSTGGSPITSYGVDYSSDSGATWSTALAPSAAMTATSYTVNGLTNGQAYRFRVVAVNAIGSGPWSATSATYTPHSTVPGAPTGVVGSNATSWSVDLSWTPPVDNGGLVIDKYVVYASIDGGTTWTLFGYEQPATTWTWTGLTPDTTYRFKAHAHNSAGWSVASAASAEVTTLAQSMPSAPRSVAGVAGNNKVALTWQVPSSTGGSPITSYGVDYSSDSGATWSTALAPSAAMTATSYTVNGLTNGQAYRFRVVAVNAIGSGPWSATSATYTPHSTVPGAPTGVVGSNATSWSVDLSWTPPVDNGGLVIDKYVVYASIDGGTTWTLFGYEQPATTWTWTGLTPDTTYRFKAHAHNSAGWSVASAASAEVTTLAQSMPSAPRSVAGVAGNNKVALTWQVPSSTGGSPITSYGVDYSSDSGATWSTALAPSAAMTATSYTVNGLTNGQAYRFRVVAVNAIGSGPWSATSATYTPHSTVPGAPTGVVGSNATSWSVDLSWTPPVDNGGLVIDKYVVYASIDGGTTWTLFGYEQPATTWTWTGLTPDTTYRFKAHAHNSAGWSVASAASAEVTTLAQSMPSAPRSVAGVAGNNKVALTWQVPSSTGGSPITSYGVDYSSDSGATWSTALAPSAAMTATSYTVNGLTNGQAYRFRVVAVNAIGSGPWSATSATYTPHSTVPGAPTGVVGSNATSWSVDLSWTPPVDNGGLVIDKYVVYASIDGGTTWTLFGYEQPATTWTWTGLTPDTTYRFKAHAHNSAGWSVASAASAEVTTLP